LYVAPAHAAGIDDLSGYLHTMKISIITAVYNGGNAIAATLRSVAGQDHSDIEHIVVDGGSNDSTLANIQSNRSRLAVLISEPDLGVYDAFNKGLRRATGDAIAFLNCGDTYLSPAVVSRMVRELSFAGVEAVFGDVQIVDAHDQTRVVRRYSSKHFAPHRMRFGLMPAHPTLFLRREIYEIIGEYDARFRIAGDFELCLRAFTGRHTQYRYIPEALVRMPAGGLSNSGWRSKLEITREMYEACSLDGVSTSFAKLCLRFPLKILEMF
jgi:glycosyltransferase involved in cell wall biosynthesis